MRISRRVLAVAILMVSQAAAGHGQAAADADAARKLVGNWTLIKYETFGDPGTPAARAFDEGRIMYDAHGNMAAQLKRKGRPVVTRGSSDADRLAAAAGYLSYYGTYRVDAAKAVVTHQVLGSTLTSWEGTTLVRYFTFSPDGKTLTLSLKTGDRVTGTLTWQRLE
jgi:hypothetical protein